MDDTGIAEPPGFGQLSKAEQVRYLQALWDRISSAPGDLPAPESHLVLAEERLAEYRRAPADGLSPYEALDRFVHERR